MAEAVPFGIATNILMKLGSSTFQEIWSVFGVKKELGKLENTLSKVRAALLDAEERQKKSRLVQDWIRKLRDVVYEADDVLDIFSTRALRRQVGNQGNKMKDQVRRFFSSSNQLAFHYKMGDRIKGISERLDEIAADMSKFNFRERTIDMGVECSERKQQSYSFVLTSEVIGRDEDKESIIEVLMCSSNNQEGVSIIPIVGIGGLGKTTLAQLVYNGETVVKFFEERIWVRVSEKFDVKLLVEKMMKSITNSEVGNLEIGQLQICLRGKLAGKRCLCWMMFGVTVTRDGFV